MIQYQTRLTGLALAVVLQIVRLVRRCLHPWAVQAATQLDQDSGAPEIN
jgi:hypothetical protein